MRPMLEQQAASAEIDVRFAGYAPTSSLNRYYAIANALVLPSVTTTSGRETWGPVVNEAMNQGAPVVASTAVGAAAGGLVRDNETGLVFPEHNVSRLTQALRRLIENPVLARKLGEAGRREVAL